MPSCRPRAREVPLNSGSPEIVAEVFFMTRLCIDFAMMATIGSMIAWKFDPKASHPLRLTDRIWSNRACSKSAKRMCSGFSRVGFLRFCLLNQFCNGESGILTRSYGMTDVQYSLMIDSDLKNLLRYIIYVDTTTVSLSAGEILLFKSKSFFNGGYLRWVIARSSESLGNQL